MIKMLLARLASFNRLLFTTGRIYKVRSEMSFVFVNERLQSKRCIRNKTLYIYYIEKENFI